MLSIGMSLTINDFKNIFFNPKSIFAGLGSQVLILPLSAFLIAWLAPIEIQFKIGIVLIAFCPVGTTSNILVHIFKADTALSISMTVINSIICPFTIPFFVSLAAFVFANSEQNIEISFLESLVHVLLMVILPCAIGIIISYKAENFTLKMQKPLKIINPILLLLVFSIKIFVKEENSICDPLSINEMLLLTPCALILNLVGMYGGFFIGKKANLPHNQCLTIACETGLQNTALALSVATTIPESCMIQKPILCYAMFTFFTAIIFLLLHSKLKIKDLFSEKN